MEAQIQIIANIAGRFLLNPYLLSTVLVSVVAVITGFTARVGLFVEDLQYSREHRTDRSRRTTPLGTSQPQSVSSSTPSIR